MDAIPHPTRRLELLAGCARGELMQVSLSVVVF